MPPSLPTLSRASGISPNDAPGAPLVGRPTSLNFGDDVPEPDLRQRERPDID